MKLALFIALYFCRGSFGQSSLTYVEPINWPQVVGASVKFSIDTVVRAVENAKAVDLSTPYTLIENLNTSAIGPDQLIKQFVETSTQQILFGLWKSVVGIASMISYQSFIYIIDFSHFLYFNLNCLIILPANLGYGTHYTAYVDPSLTTNTWDSSFPVAISISEYSITCPPKSTKSYHFWKSDSLTGLPISNTPYDSFYYCTSERPWYQYTIAAVNKTIFSEPLYSATYKLNMIMISVSYKRLLLIFPNIYFKI